MRRGRQAGRLNKHALAWLLQCSGCEEWQEPEMGAYRYGIAAFRNLSLY